MDSAYHEGEVKIQKKFGEENQARLNGRVITDSIISGAINFIEKQTMAIVSSVDKENHVWTSLLVGDYKFATVPSPDQLLFNTELIKSDPGDKFFENISVNNQVGSLFIELNTRRRFRINGNASRRGDHIHVEVLEAYPNCPKYIQQRLISVSRTTGMLEVRKTTGNSFTKELTTWIQSSDTLFIGSQGPKMKMDASHRGGNPGFVELIDEKTLEIPDYPGNSMFNTLGNFVVNPRAGLLFVDFTKGRTLQLIGKTETRIRKQSEDDFRKTSGTGRFLRFFMDKWLLTENHHQADWEFIQYSTFNPA